MALYSYILLSALLIAGGSNGTADVQIPDYNGADVIPEIEVLAPRLGQGQPDSLDMVQGITVFGTKHEVMVQRYNAYRRRFFALSSWFGEFALYLVAGILTIAVGVVALAKIVKEYHIHLAHQHRHSQLHEYYLWRKAFLEKQQQEKCTRRS